MNDAELIEVAQFTPQSGPDRGTTIRVHFNPVSLRYTVTNTIQNKGRGNSTKQFVTQSTGKLAMELIFDTTHNGQDVRGLTEKIARFMDPYERDTKKFEAIIVLFEWGAYTFQGMMESYSETLDFFAPGGVPLRATVSVTLARQDQVFSPTAPSVDTHGSLAADHVVVPTDPNRPGGADSVSRRVGAPEAARAIGAANNQESLRFAAGGSLAIGPSISLTPPVAFATGEVSLGAESGLSAGLSLEGGRAFETGASLGGEISLGAGASFEAGIVAGSRSAGVSATGGAFAGLRRNPSSARHLAKLELRRLQPAADTASLSTDTGATFHIGGKATMEGSKSLGADVGTSISLRDRMTLDPS
ncbi:MAG: hypothetical protein D6690_11195 [Nitrospirae bacterium]|nr:MAG: hypothetical protein D6690_11195 [Nitrospirota bacterium]